MYAYLKGMLVKKTINNIVLDVNGVGYKIFTTATTLSACHDIGTELKVHTYYYVREDTQALYGFLTEEELKMFERLLTVSGVGPKAALSLVSCIQPSQFGLAVLTDDIESFTKAPGIGKKTAQKIIFELKDKLKKEGADLPEFKDIAACIPSVNDNKMSEAVSALIMLGYSSQEANKAISAVYDDKKTIEQIIKDALKQVY